MKISIVGDNKHQEVDVFSSEGYQLVAELWTKVAVKNRLMYEPTWMGIPIIQFPGDIVMLQELIWKARPDLIIETGVAHGGTAVFYASMLELLGGKGRVIGIDIEIRKYNRLAIQSHPLSRRIDLIEGSSVDLAVIEELKRRVEGSKRILVTLDSNHSYAHVLREMELYSGFVAPGGYMVVMDGLQDLIQDVPTMKLEWTAKGPLPAIIEFLNKNPQWERDSYYERMKITSSPNGFLRRKDDSVYE